jgi:hypothetical protein
VTVPLTRQGDEWRLAAPSTAGCTP